MRRILAVLGFLLVAATAFAAKPVAPVFKEAPDLELESTLPVGNHLHIWTSDVIIGMHQSQVVIGTGEDTLRHLFVARVSPGISPPSLAERFMGKAKVEFWHGGIRITAATGEQFEFSLDSGEFQAIYDVYDVKIRSIRLGETLHGGLEKLYNRPGARTEGVNVFDQSCCYAWNDCYDPFACGGGGGDGGGGGGGGCAQSCSVSCTGGSCTANCTGSYCAYCGCYPDGGAYCSCRQP